MEYDIADVVGLIWIWLMIVLSSCSVLLGWYQIKNAINATKIRSKKRPIQRAALLRFIRTFPLLMHQVFGDGHDSVLLGCCASEYDYEAEPQFSEVEENCEGQYQKPPHSHLL